MLPPVGLSQQQHSFHQCYLRNLLLGRTVCCFLPIGCLSTSLRHAVLLSTEKRGLGAQSSQGGLWAVQ